MHVLIADDDTAFTEVVATLLSEQDGVALITVANEGAAALRAATENDYDAAVIDLSMPQVGGIQVVRALRKRNPYAAVVILTGTQDEEGELQALYAGADTIIHKDSYVDELSEALKLAERRRSWPRAKIRKI